MSVPPALEEQIIISKFHFKQHYHICALPQEVEIAHTYCLSKQTLNMHDSKSQDREDRAFFIRIRPQENFHHSLHVSTRAFLGYSECSISLGGQIWAVPWGFRVGFRWRKSQQHKQAKLHLEVEPRRDWERWKGWRDGRRLLRKWGGRPRGGKRPSCRHAYLCQRRRTSSSRRWCSTLSRRFQPSRVPGVLPEAAGPVRPVQEAPRWAGQP